jgi:hypothetical protein
MQLSTSLTFHLTFWFSIYETSHVLQLLGLV